MSMNLDLLVWPSRFTGLATVIILLQLFRPPHPSKALLLIYGTLRYIKEYGLPSS
jgi:hypothetical protein